LGFPQRFVEPQLLEGVERVVMDEDRDRPLRREQMRSVLDQMEQALSGVLRRLVRRGRALR
jgi:hypothetical protein